MAEPYTQEWFDEQKAEMAREEAEEAERVRKAGRKPEQALHFLTDVWNDYLGEVDRATTEWLVELVQKQKPMKPVKTSMFPNCRACGSIVYETGGYCPSCGQRLDWEERKDE